jgi:hypothetical protein
MFIVHTDQFVCIFIFFINMGKIKKARKYGKITRRHGKNQKKRGDMGKYVKFQKRGDMGK